MRIIGGFESTVGNYRGKNQDRVLCLTDCQRTHNLSVGCICDGIGSLENSEIASTIVTEGIKDWYHDISIAISEKKITEEDVIRDLDNIISELNQTVWEYTRNTGEYIGCTMSLILLYDNGFYVFHVGDSRIIHVRDIVTQITQDEVTMTMSNGKVKGKLANYIGKDKKLWVNRFCGELLEGDSFMLGSDGLFSYLDVERLKTEFSSLKTEAQVQKGTENLVEEALKNGSKDNVSCVILRAVNSKKRFFFHCK